MVQTSSLPVLAQYLLDKVETDKVSLGVVDVFYGDQNRFPNYPTVCVEPSDKDRELHGAPRRTQVDTTIYILIYHGKVQDVRQNLKECDILAEAVEALVHADPDLGDQVIHSLVTRVESGYATKADSIVRASRLTVVARVQEQLPSEV
jgi:hypothetical protein